MGPFTGHLLSNFGLGFITTFIQVNGLADSLIDAKELAEKYGQYVLNHSIHHDEGPIEMYNTLILVKEEIAANQYWSS